MAAHERVTDYRLSPAAQDDLDGIFDYTVRHWGLEQAVMYTQGLENACATLAATPARAQACDHIRSGYRRFEFARHVIYFRVENYGISVIRILHQRMDAPRHL